MTIELKLDTNAVLSLFPEGSEARLDLQRAVVANVVKLVVDRDIKAVTKTVEYEVRKISTQALKDTGLLAKNWSGIELSLETQQRIKQAAEDAARGAVAVAVHRAVEPYMTGIDQRLKTTLEEGLNLRLKALAKDALREALK